MKKQQFSFAFAVYGIIFLLVVIVGLERVFLVNASSYPKIFISKDLGLVDADGLTLLRKTDCKDDPIEVFNKGQYSVLRCGTYWPFAKTYLAVLNIPTF